MKMECRMYESVFPAQHDIVLAKIYHIDDIGAYAYLPEYNNIEGNNCLILCKQLLISILTGMIPLPELSNKRIRSIHKITKIGKSEIVSVIRIDESKVFLD